MKRNNQVPELEEAIYWWVKGKIADSCFVIHFKHPISFILKMRPLINMQKKFEDSIRNLALRPSSTELSCPKTFTLSLENGYPLFGSFM